MKSTLQHLLLAGLFSLMALTGFAQSSAQILVDGSPVVISPGTKFPLWLAVGQTINISTNVSSISAIEYNVTSSPAGGNILTLSGVQKITSLYTVAANKTLKVEGVMLTTAINNTGTEWVVGGNTAPNSSVMGTVDGSPVSIQSGTGSLGVGADPYAKTITLGNSTGATTLNVNAGTGGINITTPAATNVTTTLGTTGGAVFGSTTANADKITIQPQTTSGATNTGTVTTADLTAARTYTLPDANGTVAVSASGNIALSTAGDITLTGTIPSTNGGTGVNNAGTITNASNTTINGGGTLGLGGFNLTVPASGTAALGTGTNNYNTYWSGTNALSAEQFTNVVRGGMGADMTAASVGAIPYSTSTTTYGTLADVAAGSYLRSGGVGAAPVWSSITLPNTATTAGELWYSSGTGTMAALPRNATQGTILMNNASGTPSWSTLASLPSTSGIIPPANLGTGTPTGTTFLNGTGAWSVPTVTLAGGTNNALTYWNSASTLGAATTGTPANGMYWDNTNGFLGVGTTAPANKLHVTGAGTVALFESTNTAANQVSQIQIKSGAASNYLWSANENSTSWGGAGSLNIYSATGAMTFWTNATEKARILTNGNMGIGVTGPAEKLEVNGNVKATAYKFGDNTTQSTALAVANFFGQLNNASTIAAHTENYCRFAQVQNSDAAVFQVNTGGNYGITILKAGIIQWTYTQDIIPVSGGSNYVYMGAYINGGLTNYVLTGYQVGHWNMLNHCGTYSVAAGTTLTFGFPTVGAVASIDPSSWSNLSVTWFGAK